MASGSSANCTYVASDQTHILIDAGLGVRETVRRLALLGADVAALSAVCVTHEHSDHQASLGALQRNFRVPLFANKPTIEALERKEKLKGLNWNVFTTGTAFPVGDLMIDPFPVPHDSYEPVGFVVSCGSCRVGVVTDMGIVTEVVRRRLLDCDALVVECNHDTEMLREAARPWALKQRIAGRQGHLSNVQAAELIADVAGTRLQAVFLAHLSSECNRPELALKAVQDRLAAASLSHVEIKLTFGDRMSEVADVRVRASV